MADGRGKEASWTLPARYHHLHRSGAAFLRAVLAGGPERGQGAVDPAGDVLTVTRNLAPAAFSGQPAKQGFVGGTVGVLAVLHTWTQQLV